MSAEQLINRIEDQGLLGPEIIEYLRGQLAQSSSPVSSEAIADALVGKGHLTRFQADKLLSEMIEPPSLKKNQPDSQTGDRSRWKDSSGGDPPASDDLGLASSDSLDDLKAGPAKRAAKKKPRPSSPIETPAEPAAIDLGASEDLLGPLDGFGQESSLDEFSAAEQSNPLMPAEKKATLMSSLGFSGAKRRSQWDSPLLLIGGGALGLLLIAFVFLLLWFTRGKASDMFNLAEEDYRNSAYSQSIAKYDKFIKKYPQDPNVSLAQVRRNIARLRMAVESSRDWEQALIVASEILPAIEEEEAFDEARPELATLLPAIAQGFSEDAKNDSENLLTTEDKEKLIGLVGQAMKLVKNPAYIPSSLFRNIEARIEKIQETVDIVQREIDRDRDLVAAVASIGEAASLGKTAEAYAIRKQLLKKYPGLGSDESLQEAILGVTEKEKDLVKVVEQESKPTTEEDPRVAESSVFFSSSSGADSGAKGQVVVLASGAVYGLDVASGKTLWRRYVGYETTIHPRPVSKQAGADVLVVDRRKQELLRLRAVDGGIVWRLAVGEPFAEPVISEDKIFLSAESGQIWEIDLASGNSSRRVQLPQTLGTGPGLDTRRPQIYQVGEHSNLYVLSMKELECREVYYLGHKAGTVEVRPALVLGYLLVGENAGSDYSLLHVLSTKANGLEIEEAIEPLRFKGRIINQIVVQGRLAAVVTDLGEIHVLSIDPARPEQPVTQVAEVVATSKESVATYSVLQSGVLWLAENRLLKYEVQTSRGRLVRRQVRYDSDAFIGPLHIFGDVVVSIRRRNRSPGVTVAAMKSSDATVLWQTNLSVPAAGLIASTETGGSAVKVSALGELFDAGAEVLKTGANGSPLETANSSGRVASFLNQAVLEDGRIVFSDLSDPSRIVMFDAKQKTNRLRMMRIDSQQAKSMAAPVAFMGGFLAPLGNSQVSLFTMNQAGGKIHPFQPTLEAGATIKWSRPAVVGAQKKEFVIAATNHLYRIGVSAKEPRNLVQLGDTVDLDAVVNFPLAAVGDTLYVVASKSGSDLVLSFNSTTLEAGKEWPLDGKVIWGPEQVGDTVLLATDSEGLLCFESGQKLRWKVSLTHGVPVGMPLAVDGDFVFCSSQGVIWRTAGTDGADIKSIDLGEPLGLGPVLDGDKLLLSGNDGTLHVLPMLTP